MSSKDANLSGTSNSFNKSYDTSEITDKVRVLCLHGYHQSGDAFKNKIGAFRKFAGKYAEFVFISAPHVAKPRNPGEEIDDNKRSWWANKDDGTFKGTNKAGPAFGFQESLRTVEKAWKEQGPFQGLLGFSQGACLVGLICGLAKKKLTSIHPEFAVICAGFISGSLVHMSVYEERIIIPSLHIYGLTDDIIPKDMSEALAAHFKNAEFLEHDGGHYFPATSSLKQTYINFFQDRLQEYLENLELQQNNMANESLIESCDESGGNRSPDADDAEVAAMIGSEIDDSN